MLFQISPSSHTLHHHPFAGTCRTSGGSGLSVVAPPPDKANSGASSIWEQVKENAQAGAAESGGGHGSPPDGTIVITRYRNGYTVNDGSLQAADSSEGIQFFSLLARNLIPKGMVFLSTCLISLSVSMCVSFLHSYTRIHFPLSPSFSLNPSRRNCRARGGPRQRPRNQCFTPRQNQRGLGLQGSSPA